MDGQAGPTSSDGVAWVEAGTVRVRNPLGLGRWPKVVVPAGGKIDLVVNGEARAGEVVLRAEDRVEVSCPAVETPGHVDIEVAADAMEARVTIVPGRSVRHRVVDARPTNRLRLEVEDLLETQPLALTTSDVLDALHAAGVIVGIAEARVGRALQTPGTPVLVGQGRPAVPGHAAAVWTCSGAETGLSATASHSTPAAPTRLQVEAGEPVVQVTPGRPAVPGQTVRGDPIIPEQAWQPTVVAGPGTLLSADGCTLIAALAGHPVVQIDSDAELIYATVAPERQIPGDVDGATGDITYEGDVWIGGSIQPERAVLVTGHAEVTGHVGPARVIAGGGICIHGGAANALLIAGGPALSYARTLLLCEELLRSLDTLTPAADGGPGKRPVALAARVRQEIQGIEIHLDPPVEALGTVLEPFCHSATLRDIWSGSGEELIKHLRLAAERIREVLNRPGECVVRHLENTRIEATGNVIIGDRGALHSQIATLGEVRVSGAFRGGTIWALRGARLASVGGGEDTLTRVDIGPLGPFEATEVRQGTVVLRAGAVVRRFDAPAHEVLITPGARLTSDGCP